MVYGKPVTGSALYQQRSLAKRAPLYRDLATGRTPTLAYVLILAITVLWGRVREALVATRTLKTLVPVSYTHLTLPTKAEV